MEPGDCFALATYKIHSALQKEQKEQLPYIFAIVGDPELSGESVGSKLDDQLVKAVALISRSPRASGKRDLEDMVVSHLASSGHPAYVETFARVASAQWYVLSARRAYKLLRDKLFERVFA